MLDSTGLSQYKDTFSREAIDGETFMLLDDQILAEELGITSRLHRAKILKLTGNL